MSDATTDRLAVDVYLTTDDQRSTMARDVRLGLTAKQKYLLAKYFYDDRGSVLFEQITELPEYYQTRTELEILTAIAPGLAERYPVTELVELGSGSSRKTTTLLDAMHAQGSLRQYMPIDVSELMLRESSAALLDRYPGLAIHGIVGDFTRHLGAVPPAPGRRMLVFLGSTIGNLNDDERSEFLRSVRQNSRPGDAFLLGVDLVKSVETLEAAYDDAAGVTAAFNKNILSVLNRALGADFDVDAFQHRAFYNATHERIEMHLVPASHQTVHIRELDLTITVEPNETIWTEISCKFTRDSIAAALGAADLDLVEWHTDSLERFGVLVAEPRLA